MATVVTETRRGAAIPACLFAWLLPGAGHLYLRRTVKGLVFLGAIGTLFVLGVAMDARLQMSLGLDDILASLFSLAQMAIGVPYFAARALGFEAGQVTSVTHEYGKGSRGTYTAYVEAVNALTRTGVGSATVTIKRR